MKTPMTDKSKELSIELCTWFANKNINSKIGTGALCMVLGASIAAVDDPDEAYKTVCQMIRAIADQVVEKRGRPLDTTIN